jgi:hypothetical protein
MDTELSNQILIMAVTSALFQLTATCVVWLVLHVLKIYHPFGRGNWQLKQTAG